MLLDFWHTVIQSKTVWAFALMIPLGLVLEVAMGARMARRRVLNLKYAPVFLVFELTILYLFLLMGKHLQDRLGWHQPMLPSIAWLEHMQSVGELIVFMVVLDGLLYGMHRLQHQFSILWCCHRLHHSDPSVDVTTTTRMHPIDQLMKGVFVVVPFVFVFPMPDITAPEYVIPFAWLYYIHLNIDVSHGRLWWLITSPRYHVIHHDRLAARQGTNFAVFFPFWDILFGTATRPHLGLVVTGSEGSSPRTLKDMLLSPLRLPHP